jgi:hypothetical protein
VCSFDVLYPLGSPTRSALHTGRYPIRYVGGPLASRDVETADGAEALLTRSTRLQVRTADRGDTKHEGVWAQPDGEASSAVHERARVQHPRRWKVRAVSLSLAAAPVQSLVSRSYSLPTPTTAHIARKVASWALQLEVHPDVQRL